MKTLFTFISTLLLGFIAYTAHIDTTNVPAPSLGDGYGSNTIFGIPTQGTATVGSSTLILATSTGRNYLNIANDGATTVYLGIGQAAVVGRGIRVPANTSYELKMDEMFTAAIYGVATASTSVSYVESSVR